MIPSTVYHYLQIAASNNPKKQYAYRMCGVSQRHQQEALQYRAGHIQKISSLAAQDFEQIKLFNDIFIQEGNALSFRLMFHTLRDGCFLCCLTSYGTLKILLHDKQGVWKGVESGGLCRPPSSSKEEDEDEDVTYMASSTYTIFHDYAQIRNTEADLYYHVGISFVPSGVLFVPVLLDEQRLSKLLDEWQSRKLPKAKRESIITFRMLSGDSHARYVVPRINQRNLLDQSIRGTTTAV